MENIKSKDIKTLREHSEKHTTIKLPRGFNRLICAKYGSNDDEYSTFLTLADANSLLHNAKYCYNASLPITENRQWDYYYKKLKYIRKPQVNIFHGFRKTHSSIIKLSETKY